MNPHDLTNLADAVGATCHTHSIGRATSIMFSMHQLEQFAERLVAAEREKRIAAQTEAEALKVKLARSGVEIQLQHPRRKVEQNRAILKERENTEVLIARAKQEAVDAHIAMFGDSRVTQEKE